MKLSKNQLKQIRYLLEYILAMPFFLILKPFSVKNKGRFGTFLGRFAMYPFLKYKQKKRYNILKKNIGIIYKEEFTEKQKDDIIKNYCSNIARIFTEGLGQKQMDKKWLTNNVTVTNLEQFINAYKQGRKIIIASAHIGNWEIAHKYLYEVYGINVTILYRKQNNIMLDEVYVKNRRHVELIEKRDKSSLKKMIKSLNDGRVVVVLLDQTDRTHGVPIQLFGKTTYFPSAITKLAIKNDAYIFCGYCHRNSENGNTFGLSFEEPVIYDKTSTPQDITQKIFTIFEKWITKYPTQWFCLIQDIWR